jgi:hypothetical protein
MAKTIEFGLSKKSINAAIKNLTKYKADFIKKNEQLVRDLSQIGLSVIEVKINAAMGDADKSHTSRANFTNEGAIVSAEIVVNGKDIVFIEFGAGEYYNETNHPMANKFGYTIGSYGKGQGLVPGYWYYSKDDKGSQLSVGTEATMPLYSASVEMLQQVETVARQVFGR